MPKYKTGSTPPHTHTNTRKGTLNTKTTLQKNHSKKSPRQRKTTKKHYKMRNASNHYCEQQPDF